MAQLIGNDIWEESNVWGNIQNESLVDNIEKFCPK